MVIGFYLCKENKQSCEGVSPSLNPTSHPVKCTSIDSDPYSIRFID